MMGDLEAIIFFVPFLYLSFYIMAFSVIKKMFP